MKKVFLSADDFGRSPNRNKAIDESFKKGLIKSAGLIVTGQYLQDAVSQINRGGGVCRACSLSFQRVRQSQWRRFSRSAFDRKDGQG